VLSDNLLVARSLSTLPPLPLLRHVRCYSSMKLGMCNFSCVDIGLLATLSCLGIVTKWWNWNKLTVDAIPVKAGENSPFESLNLLEASFPDHQLLQWSPHSQTTNCYSGRLIPRPPTDTVVASFPDHQLLQWSPHSQTTNCYSDRPIPKPPTATVVASFPNHQLLHQVVMICLLLRVIHNCLQIKSNK